MEHRFRISIPTDADGFLSQRCPSCLKRFKVRLDEQDEHLLGHCPYCGSGSAEGWEGWLTEEQQRYFEAMAMGHAEDVAEAMMADAFRGLKGFSFEKSPSRRSTPPKPLESDDPMPVFTSSCCNEPVKHDGSAAILHCVVCGNTAATGG